MLSTRRQHNAFLRISLRPSSLRRVVQTWVMAFVILLAGVTQSGFIPALLLGGEIGVAGAQAAPGGNVILICTGDGIQTIVFGPDGPEISENTDHPAQTAGHGFCSLCASHHGAVVDVSLPYVEPVSISHDVSFAAAIGVAKGHEIPRSRQPRAPPHSV